MSCISAVAEESDASTLAPKLDNAIEAALPLRPNPSTNTLTPLKSVTVSLPSCPYSYLYLFLFRIFENDLLFGFARPMRSAFNVASTRYVFSCVIINPTGF
jgi:hypothetical protein